MSKPKKSMLRGLLLAAFVLAPCTTFAQQRFDLTMNDVPYAIEIPEGYVRASIEAPGILAFFARMEVGGELDEVLIARTDLDLIAQGQDPQSAAYKLRGEKPMSKGSAVSKEAWKRYRADIIQTMSKIDTKALSGFVEDRIDGAMKTASEPIDMGVENAAVGVPALHRTDDNSARFSATLIYDIKTEGKAEKVKELNFGALVYAKARTLLISSTQVNHGDLDRNAAQAMFDAFVDRLIALNP